MHCDYLKCKKDFSKSEQIVFGTKWKKIEQSGAKLKQNGVWHQYSGRNFDLVSLVHATGLFTELFHSTQNTCTPVIPSLSLLELTKHNFVASNSDDHVI